MSASYIRFNTGEISLSQLKHLLAVYYGEEQCDLGTDVPAHFSRKKSASSSDPNGQAFINQVEALIAEMESHRINGNQPIPPVYKTRLNQLLKDPANKWKAGPELSLARRIAAPLHFDMKPEIMFDIDAIFSYLTTIVMACSLRVCLGTSMFGFVLSCQLLTGILNYLNSKRVGEPAKAADDKEIVPLSDDPQFLPLITQSEEFAKKLRLPAAPQLYLVKSKVRAFVDPAGARMPTSQAPAGTIEFRNDLFKSHDFEEQKAVLAHEMGHIHSFFNSNNRGLQAASSKIAGFAAFTASKMASILLTNFGFKKLIPFETTVIISLSLFLNKIFRQREEIYADNIAKKLAGPLADASAHRTEHRLFYPRRIADFLSRHSYVAKFFNATGLDDAFCAHPATKKRM